MTPCTIITKLGPEMYLLAQCMSSGYVSGVSATLLEHYKTDFDVLALVSIGEFSPLGETPQITREENMGYDNQITGYPIAFKDESVMKLDNFCGPNNYVHERGGYEYLWQDSEWYARIENVDGTMKPWIKLVDALVDSNYNEFL
jgi:hypothetical protein